MDQSIVLRQSCNWISFWYVVNNEPLFLSYLLKISLRNKNKNTASVIKDIGPVIFFGGGGGVRGQGCCPCCLASHQCHSGWNHSVNRYIQILFFQHMKMFIWWGTMRKWLFVVCLSWRHAHEWVHVITMQLLMTGLTFLASFAISEMNTGPSM